ncbi:hypothetical protein GOP47_0002841 [Adiantum capillus-veneris]|uniref:Rubredoxin-like domain-containing protein n=1 Tax=Adiantum capillus-veneris TaxID=13818 RepID=A0A9D4VBA9_ADICA|nr:hypothetical protein GOP47_0002841 [Adiantum capillus-veneris]
MATLELPLQVQTTVCKSASGFAGKECCVVRMRFAPPSGSGSSLSLSCKDVRSRIPRCMSVDVESDSAQTSAEPDPQSVEARRAAEKFAVINTGKWECRSCGYVYEESKGEAAYPIAAGTEFRNLPEDWRCPICGAGQSYFNSKSVEVAGFAENQNYGLGTNSLTSGQKSLLIYGSLLLFFCLFLSGYFLQ